MDEHDPRCLTNTVSEHSYRPLQFNPSAYMQYVDDLALTEEQKTEFLRTLWEIMATFVRLGFNAEAALPLVFQKASENGVDTVQDPIPTHDFNVASDDGANGKAE